MSSVSYKIVNMKGAEVGTMNLDPEVFAGAVNEALVHEVVTWQRNKKRAGTHATLNRAKIQATGKKLYKQKGTGRARHSSAVSPIFVGGAVTFGPQPRSYETSLNKKQRKQALVSVLTEKASAAKLVILDDLSSDGKTKGFASVVRNIGVEKGGSVFVIGSEHALVQRAARNVQKVQTLPVDGVNVYDLMKHKYLVCTKAGIEALQKRVKGAN